MTVASGCALFLVLSFLLYEDSHTLPQPPERRRHVCQNPRIFAENMERHLRRDVMFKTVQRMEIADEWFENWLPVYNSTKDCLKYKYRPIRLLALTELMNDVKNSPEVVKVKSEQIEKYKRIVEEVLVEFQELFQVPYDHVGGAGNVSIDRLLRKYVDITNKDTLNNLKIDMVFSVSYSDSSKTKWKTCERPSVLAYATALEPYAVKLPNYNCDLLNKGKNLVMRHRAGHVAICPASNDRTDAEVKATIRHELLHAMGFNAYPCLLDADHKLFRLQTNNYYSIPRSEAMTNDPQFKWGTRYVMTFVGTRVVEAARRHYNCGDLEGMPFEDDTFGANSFRLNKAESRFWQRVHSCKALLGHWEEYHTGVSAHPISFTTCTLENDEFARQGKAGWNELMGPIIDPYNVFSSITAAFFEDVYMYRVNRKRIEYEMQTFKYGKNYGCEFIKRGCRSWIELNQQLSNENDRKVCSFPIVSRNVLEGTAYQCFKKRPVCYYEEKLLDSHSGSQYNVSAYVVSMHSGLNDPLKSAKYYYTLTKPLKATWGNATENRTDGPFSIRNAGYGMTEYCPVWRIHGGQKENVEMYGHRPSHCPTTPSEIERPHSGCIQEGNTGPDYNWCPFDPWSEWSDCVSSFRRRQRVRKCESVDSSNCEGRNREMQGDICPMQKPEEK